MEKADFRSIVENIPHGILILDKDGTILYANPACEELFGIPQADLVGMAFGHPLREIIPFEIDLPQRSGGPGVAEVRVKAITWAGKPCFVASLTDVTALVSLRAAIEQAKEGVVIGDKNGIIHFINSAFEEITGCTREECLGKSILEVIASQAKDSIERKKWDEVYDEIYGSIAKGQPWQGQWAHRHKDGRLFTVEVIVSPVKDNEGNILGYIGLGRDITEKIRAEESKARLEARLQHSQKMQAIGTLASGVAHDFNNLLTTIMGNGELVLSELAEDDPHVKDLQEIKKACERGANLVRQLLAFGRRGIRFPEVLDLNEHLKGMEKMLRRLLREDIDFKLILYPDLWPVYIDPTQMDQVIINLVTNARDAMPKGGSLTIGTSNKELDKDYLLLQGINKKPGPYVVLTVKDTGVGIDKELQERIFEPFFTTKPREIGTGLGLATVHRIIEQNGGFVLTHSELNQGTTVEVYLPKAEDKMKATHGQDIEPEPSELAGDETVHH